MFVLSEPKVDSAVRDLYIGVKFPDLPQVSVFSVNKTAQSPYVRALRSAATHYKELRNSS